MNVALGFLAALGLVAYFIGMTIFRGWTLSVLWGWFVVTTFGLPALSIPQAIGATIVVSFFTYQYHYSKENEDNWGRAIVFGILFPLVSLGVGYIVKGYL